MGSVGTGRRAVAPERGPQTPWRVLLTSPSLAKCLNHSLRAYLGTRQSTTKRWRAQPAAYAAPLGSLTSSPAPPTPTDS